MKNRESANLSHGERNQIIYDAIKSTPEGITRQELTTVTNYEINETSSAVAELVQKGEIFESGYRINPISGQKNGVLYINSDWSTPIPPTRRGELAKLRKENEQQKKEIVQLKTDLNSAQALAQHADLLFAENLELEAELVNAKTEIEKLKRNTRLFLIKNGLFPPFVH